MCVFSTHIKRQPCYSSTKYAKTVVFLRIQLFYFAPYVCRICTRNRYILTLIHKKTQSNTILTMGNSKIWHEYIIKERHQGDRSARYGSHADPIRIQNG